MIEIPLTKGYVAIIDDEDADLAQRKWTAMVSGKFVYGKRTIHPKMGDEIQKQRMILLHREIIRRVIGREPQRNEYVDHADGNGLNNSRSNLRLCTPSQNGQNRKKKDGTKSKFKGVVENKNCPNKPWEAKLKINRKNILLGSFATQEEAHAAYCEAGRKYFGEFFRAA